MRFPLFSESKNTFEGIHDDETVVMLIRQHWFIPVTQVAALLLAWIVPFFFLVFGSYFLAVHNLFGIMLLAFSLYTMVLWYGAFYTLMLYDLNTLIITNHRIIDNRQHAFFSRTASEVSLSRVQDVTIEIEGFIQTFLNFGDINIQTAGAQNEFRFELIPNPEGIKEHITAQSSTYPLPVKQKTP
jgi:uncharacterized membrane protein YdbT with pleckstrin-like domain